MTDLTKVQSELDALVAAMTEKGIEKPQASFTIYNGGRAALGVTNPKKGELLSNVWFHGEDFDAVLAQAVAFVAKLPRPEEAGICRYMEQVAKTVEVGRAENIPDQYVVPFREVLTAMTENLLPAPKAEVA